MPGPFTLVDEYGDNYVDSVGRKVDEQGTVYYEVRGRNNSNAQRVLRIYNNNVVKPYVSADGVDKQIATMGQVHLQMQDSLSTLLKHFAIAEPLDFNPSIKKIVPYPLIDVEGDNYADSIARKIDESGAVYYEVKGRNNSGDERTVHIYDNNVVKPYIVQSGIKIEATTRGQVHNQLIENLTSIMTHFSIPAPLNFINPDLIKASEIIIPKKPPAIIPPTVEEALPSRNFFIEAAQRAFERGDIVSAKQKGVHNTRTALIGAGSKYYDEGNSTRLNLFHSLVAGSKDGYYPFAATTAYGLSLLTYIATNYDILDKTQIKRLYQIYKSVAGDIPASGLDPASAEYRLALAKGLKAEVNEITALRERLSYNKSVTTSLAEYTRDLVRGNAHGRVVIDNQTSTNAISGTEGGLTRTIPGFFPIPPSSGTSDQIVLQAGGCKTHSAIVSIWKQGVDSEGNPVIPGDGMSIVRYRVYRTVCNAGFGTTYDVRTTPPALYHEIFSPASDGQTYSVCTQEVLLPVGVSYSDERMQKQIEDLVAAERSLLLFHDLPGKKGPNNEVGTMDTAKQAEWRKLNQSIRLGPVESTHSVLSPPQTTGNCTVRSIEEYLRWELIRTGVPKRDAAMVLDSHWDFASKNDSTSIGKKLTALQVKTKSTEVEVEQAAAVTMNLVKVKPFFSKPVVPPFPRYLPDMSSQKDTDVLVEKIRANTVDCPKPTMMTIADLLSQAPKKQIKSEKTVGYHLLQGCDARVVPGFACMQGAVRQVASQFNNGESPNRYATSPNHFESDHTQGPAEQRTAGGAAIARYAHSKSCDSLSMLLADPQIKLEFDGLFNYQFGYLTPKGGQEQKGLEFLKTHINQLALNVERVALDSGPGQTAIQVLNSGLALGQYDLYKRKPENVRYLKEMTELVLTAQYKAVASVALLEAESNPTKRIPVSFTMVGGGAFGNDKTAIAKALSQAIKLINESGLNNIDICLSIYNPSEIEEYKQLTAHGDDFADIRAVLNQKPITQGQLISLPTLAPQESVSVAVEVSLEEPLIEHIEQPLAKKTYANANLEQAMRAAIDALSSKSHLAMQGREQKKALLEQHLSAYEHSTSEQSANQAILKFVIAASTQRQSNWSSFFTSKFGETASAKVFFKHINNDELKKLVLDAAQVPSSTTGNFEFKEFAKQIRDKYGKEDGPTPGLDV